MNVRFDTLLNCRQSSYRTLPSNVAMKFCRFKRDGHINYGLIESVAGRETVTAVTFDPPLRDERNYKKIPGIPLADAALLCPAQPSKIVCIGRNYREHAAELGNEVP